MKQPGTSVAGFTLVELLAVIAIVAVLAGLLLPGLARARDRATAAACQNHLRHLQVAFQLYADDHRGELTPSETEISRPNGTHWVNGIMSPFAANSLSELTNRQLLIEPGPGHLGP